MEKVVVDLPSDTPLASVASKISGCQFPLREGVSFSGFSTRAMILANSFLKWSLASLAFTPYLHPGVKCNNISAASPFRVMVAGQVTTALVTLQKAP